MKVEKFVPEVYYKESRDFAYIGRLIEVLFNYMKTSADCVNMNIDNENIEGNLIDLLVNTLGFELRHNYVNKDLIVIASAFNTLLKNKGNIIAIELAIKLLLNSQGIKSQNDFEFCVFDEDNSEITINIPDELSDIILLEDLFDYILPAGVIYKFARFGGIDDNNLTKTKLSIDKPISISVDDDDLGVIETENLGFIKVDANSNENDKHDALGSFYTGVVVSSIKTKQDTGGN